MGDWRGGSGGGGAGGGWVWWGCAGKEKPRGLEALICGCVPTWFSFPALPHPCIRVEMVTAFGVNSASLILSSHANASFIRPILANK